MSNEKEKLIELLNKFDEEGMLPLVFGALISSDVLVDIESCDMAIERIDKFLSVFDETEIKHKKRWKKMLKDGLEIAKRNKEQFLKEKIAGNGDI